MRKTIFNLVIIALTFAACKKENTPTPTPTSNNTNTNTNTGNSRIEFEKIIGGNNTFEEGKYVIQTPDGGYLVAGTELVKTDTKGIVVFTKPIAANSIMLTKDGNYILAGQTSSKLYKIDTSGTILWEQNAPTILSFIYQTSDEGYIGCGNGSVVKTDASGNEVWKQQLGTKGLNDNFHSEEVRQTTDGGYVVVGTQVTGYNWDSQFIVYKLDASGTILWVKEFGSTSYSDEGSSIKATPDGGCIAAGMSGGGFFDMKLIKMDASGKTLWSQTYGKSDVSESASYVQLTSDGGYILVGSTDLDGEWNTSNVYVVKTNSSGVKTWEENFGGTDKDYGFCVQQTSDGGYIITGKGNYTGSNSSGDMYLLKLKK